MKNRTYKSHNRSIKEVRAGVWECRITAPKGMPAIKPFETDTKDGAFNWLRGGPTNNITPGYLNSKARRKLRRKSARRKLRRKSRK